MGDQVGFESGQMGCGSKWVILSELKGVRVNRIAGQVGLTRIFHFLFIIYIYIYINNMYLPFGKSCNKLLDVKCIILNSPLIS